MSTLTMQIKGATREEFSQVALAHGWEIDAVGRMARWTEAIMESRKLLSLALVIVGILALTFMWIVCSAMWGTPWGPFDQILTAINIAGGSHQAAQGASDYAKWRASGTAGYALDAGAYPAPYATPPAPSSATPPWTPPAGTGAQV